MQEEEWEMKGRGRVGEEAEGEMEGGKEDRKEGSFDDIDTTLYVLAMILVDFSSTYHSCLGTVEPGRRPPML